MPRPEDTLVLLACARYRADLLARVWDAQAAALDTGDLETLVQLRALEVAWCNVQLAAGRGLRDALDRLRPARHAHPGPRPPPAAVGQ